MMNPERARALLGVGEGDDLGAVRSAYEDLLRRHPTLEDPPPLGELRQAFEVLQDLAHGGEGPAALPSLGDGAVSGAGGEEGAASAGETLTWTPLLSTTGSGDDGGDRTLGAIGESTSDGSTTDDRFGSWQPEFPWERRLGGGAADESSPDETTSRFTTREETPPAGATAARKPVAPPPPPTESAPVPIPPREPESGSSAESSAETETEPGAGARSEPEDDIESGTLSETEPASVRWATTDEVGAGDWRLRYSRGQVSADRGCLVGALVLTVTVFVMALFYVTVVA